MRTVEDFKRVVTNARPMPRGAEAVALVASGEADIGLLPLSEIIHAPGVEVAGVIADEIQLHQMARQARASCFLGIRARPGDS